MPRKPFLSEPARTQERDTHSWVRRERLRTSGRDGGCGCAFGPRHQPSHCWFYRQAAAKPPGSGSCAQDAKPMNVANGAGLSTRLAISKEPKQVRPSPWGAFQKADSLITGRAHPVKRRNPKCVGMGVTATERPGPGAALHHELTQAVSRQAKAMAVRAATGESVAAFVRPVARRPRLTGQQALIRHATESQANLASVTRSVEATTQQAGSRRGGTPLGASTAPVSVASRHKADAELPHAQPVASTIKAFHQTLRENVPQGQQKKWRSAVQSSGSMYSRTAVGAPVSHVQFGRVARRGHSTRWTADAHSSGSGCFFDVSYT